MNEPRVGEKAAALSQPQNGSVFFWRLACYITERSWIAGTRCRFRFLLFPLVSSVRFSGLTQGIPPSAQTTPAVQAAI